MNTAGSNIRIYVKGGRLMENVEMTDVDMHIKRNANIFIKGNAKE